MSAGVRIFLGVFLVLIAAAFLAMTPLFAAAGDVFSVRTTYLMGGLGVLCGLGAVACFSRASHPVTVRIIGGTIFAACLGYVASQALGDAPAPAKAQAGNPIMVGIRRRGEPSLVNSLEFFLLVGLPSGYCAITGRYPGWGRLAAAFGGDARK